MTKRKFNEKGCLNIVCLFGMPKLMQVDVVVLYVYAYEAFTKDPVTDTLLIR